MRSAVTFWEYMKDDEIIETQYLRTYVKHKESSKCFLVSSVHKKGNNNALSNSETMVWEWDSDKGEIVGCSR